MNSSPNIRGAFLGLDLVHTQADVIRSAMEGIAFELRIALDALRKIDSFQNEMLVVGGGSHSALWRQIFADIYEMDIVKTNIDQQAAALGAAACAAVGTGLWDNFEFIDELHQVQAVSHPIPDNVSIYKDLLPVFKKSEKSLAEIGDLLVALKGK